MSNANRYIFSILIENQSGALSRVAGLFSARGFNIDSITVATTNDSTLSRMTIVTICDSDVIQQIIKQLNKLIDVVKVVNLTNEKHIERELILVKVKSSNQYRLEVKQLVDIFAGKVVDVSKNTYTIELTGKSRKLDAFLEALQEISSTLILETASSGITSIARGKNIL